MMKSINKIAIVKLSAMGDVIHAMLALQFLKKNNPGLKIDWFVEKAFAEVLNHNPDISNVFILELKKLKKSKKNIFSTIKEIKEYKNNNYDLVIDAQGLIKSAFVSKLISKNIIGFSKESTREGLASYFYKHKVKISYEENVITRNLEVICSAFDIKVTEKDIVNKKAFLYFDKNKNMSKYQNKIIFVVGASKPNKVYPKERFLALANLLKEEIIVVWGNEEESTIASYLDEHSEYLVKAPRGDLNDLKTMISMCKLLIGGDTGPTHMAWALNIASITIFGNTPSNRNTYITNINRVIESSSKVNALKLDKNDFSIRDIDENSIYSLAKQLLII